MSIRISDLVLLPFRGPDKIAKTTCGVADSLFFYNYKNKSAPINLITIKPARSTAAFFHREAREREKNGNLGPLSHSPEREEYLDTKKGIKGDTTLEFIPLGYE